MKYTEEQVKDVLRAKLLRYDNVQRRLAKTLEITPAYLNDILSGKRGISEMVANKLGFERQVIFVRKER